MLENGKEAAVQNLVDSLAFYIECKRLKRKGQADKQLAACLAFIAQALAGRTKTIDGYPALASNFVAWLESLSLDEILSSYETANMRLDACYAACSQMDRFLSDAQANLQVIRQQGASFSSICNHLEACLDKVKLNAQSVAEPEQVNSLYMKLQAPLATIFENLMNMLEPELKILRIFDRIPAACNWMIRGMTAKAQLEACFIHKCNFSEDIVLLNSSINSARTAMNYLHVELIGKEKKHREFEQLEREKQIRILTARKYSNIYTKVLSGYESIADAPRYIIPSILTVVMVLAFNITVDDIPFILRLITIGVGIGSSLGIWVGCSAFKYKLEIIKKNNWSESKLRLLTSIIEKESVTSYQKPDCAIYDGTCTPSLGGKLDRYGWVQRFPGSKQFVPLSKIGEAIDG